MRSSIRLIPITLLMAFFPIAGGAQTAEPVVDFKYEVEAARDQMDKQRRIVLAGELNLTAEEREAFWPLFNKYAAELREAGDLQVKLIGDYADQYDRMTNEFAERMLDEYIDYHQQALKVKKKYIPRFKKVIPSTKVARLYQVESKLASVIDFNLASKIPLVQDEKSN